MKSKLTPWEIAKNTLSDCEEMQALRYGLYADAEDAIRAQGLTAADMVNANTWLKGSTYDNAYGDSAEFSIAFILELLDFDKQAADAEYQFAQERLQALEEEEWKAQFEK